MKPEATPRKLLGILGGTFDPVHNAHLQLADAARAACGLAAIRWIPAGQPPHRDPPLAAPEHRLAMLRLALAGRTGDSIDDAEILAAGKSYTVPTLERLRAELGKEQPLALIVGADAFLGLPTWHRWQEIFTLAHIVVTERARAPLVESTLPAQLVAPWRERRVTEADFLRRTSGGKIFVFAMPANPLSATALRTRLKAGEDVASLLPASVVGYIQRHSLYV